MSTGQHDTERPPVDWQEIIFALAKHKWILLICALLGLGAAAALRLTHQPLYQSHARLLVRYVLERNAIDSVDSSVGTSNRYSDGVIRSEVEILTSWDLALQVAKTIGPAVLVPSAKSAPTEIDAAIAVRRGLTVTTSKGSNVIAITYENPDPAVAVQVLETLVSRYFEKHLEIHRSIGAFEFVAQQTADVRTRLDQTEAELKRLKAQAKIISLAETTSAINTALTRKQEELYGADVELASQRARVDQLEKWLARNSSSQRTGTSAAPASSGDVQQYRALTARLAALRQEGLDLRSIFTAENKLVKLNQDQVAQLESQKRELEENFPELTAAALSASSSSSQPSLLSERARLAEIEAKAEMLKAQLGAIRTTAEELSEVGPLIAQLERRKEVEEANYRYFQASLEKARIDEALDPSKIPNINVVQKPSPANAVQGDLNKTMAGLAGGGVVLGLGLVLLVGYVFDRTIKRPQELETKLGLAYLASIPFFPFMRHRDPGHARRRELAANGAPHEPSVQPIGPVERRSPRIDRCLRRHSEGIRDRLILSLELAGKTHKPKLIAVTGCSEGAGTSTLAESLAGALSRTGSGKVLLVDMNIARHDSNGQFAGSPTFSVFEVLQADRTITPVSGNLYLATAAPTTSETKQPIPTNFYDLVPRFKGSDFDYVIFDAPPVSESSAALLIAALMDKVVLVVEAEKSTRDAVKRTHAELAAAKADIALVFNKARTYGPQWLNN